MLYMDEGGYVRDDDTGHFASVTDYLDQLMREAVELEAFEEMFEGVDPEELEELVAEGGYPELELDDLPDYWLEPEDEVELTVDLAYDETD